MFALFLILFLGGIYLMGSAFSATTLPGLVFTGGLLITSIAVGIPFLVSAIEHRGEARDNGDVSR